MDEFFQTVKEQIIPRNIDTWGDIEKYAELPNLFHKANIALDDIQRRQQNNRLFLNTDKNIFLSPPLFTIEP